MLVEHNRGFVRDVADLQIEDSEGRRDTEAVEPLRAAGSGAEEMEIDLRSHAGEEAEGFGRSA